jgi:hypothetical protein
VAKRRGAGGPSWRWDARAPLNASARRAFRLATTGSILNRRARQYLDFMRRNGGYGTAYFALTIDFELSWSIGRRGTGSTSRAQAIERGRRARRNLPVLLDLCERYQIPLTVSVVAHSALRDCDHRDPPPFAPSWVGGDWYSLDPHETIDTRPDYYGADLVSLVLERTPRHEIAAHTFTHVDLGDPETTAEVAEFELAEAYRILAPLRPELRTLIFPKDHVGFLDLVRATGYTTYRTEGWAPVERDALGLWRFPAGLWLSPQAVGPRDMRRMVDAAIAHDQLLSCYCHLYEFRTPGELERLVTPVFALLDQERAGGRISPETIRGVVDAVDRREREGLLRPPQLGVRGEVERLRTQL